MSNKSVFYLPKEEVRCTKCNRTFKTVAIIPCCKKCGSKAHIKWVRMEKKK